MRRTASMAVICTTVLASPLHAADMQWDAATGLDYYAGKYGAASDTDVLNVPLGLRAEMDRLRLELTVPYLHVRGPGILAGGVIVAANNTVTTRSGLGDVPAGAAWLLHQDSQPLPVIERAGSVKLPTASRSLAT